MSITLRFFQSVYRRYCSYNNIRKLRRAQCTFLVKPNIYYRVYVQVSKSANIFFNGKCKLTSGYGINPLSRNLMASIRVEDNAIINIGNNVAMSSPCIWIKSKLTIGNNVLIGANVSIIDSDCHSLNYMDRRIGVTNHDALHTIKKPIIIEDDVLVGMNCIILKGVTIGARSIIGAGSVVTTDIPSDVIAAGNPCKVIKSIK